MGNFLSVWYKVGELMDDEMFECIVLLTIIDYPMFHQMKYQLYYQYSIPERIMRKLKILIQKN